MDLLSELGHIQTENEITISDSTKKFLITLSVTTLLGIIIIILINKLAK